MANNSWLALISVSLRTAAWPPVLVFTIHIIAIYALPLYEYFSWFDSPMHFFGGLAISFFYGKTYLIAEDMGLLGKPVKWLGFVIVFALAGTTTIFWEFWEFLSDQYLGTHTQAGLPDTMKDMFLGLLGSVVSLSLFFVPKKSQ